MFTYLHFVGVAGGREEEEGWGWEGGGGGGRAWRLSADRAASDSTSTEELFQPHFWQV